jgi:hypothetical protein
VCVFFVESVPASLARWLGAHLVTETMERNPDIGLASYDRFFPSQDNMPSGGFGNLIALPLQHVQRSVPWRVSIAATGAISPESRTRRKMALGELRASRSHAQRTQPAQEE